MFSIAVQSDGWGCIHDHFGAEPASSQNPAHRGAADVKAAGDFGFAHASAVQLPDFRSVNGRGSRPTQPFPTLPGLSQPSSSPLPQNLPFELGENGEQSSHRATGWRGQVQCFREGNETYAEMLQFLKRCQQVGD